MNLSDLKIETALLTEIHPAPPERNHRQHDERNLAAIEASLRTFGQPEPLVVRAADGEIIAGNGRYLAMRRIQWTSCRIVRVDCDADEALALGLALNRTGDLSSFDDSLFACLAYLQNTGISPDSLGWNADDMALMQLPTTMPGGWAGDTGLDDSSDGLPPSMGKSIALTTEQREIFNQGWERLKAQEQDATISPGRCVELIFADWLSGA